MGNSRRVQTLQSVPECRRSALCACRNRARGRPPDCAAPTPHATARCNGGVQLRSDGANHVLERRQLRPGLRRAAHVIQDQSRASPCTTARASSGSKVSPLGSLMIARAQLDRLFRDGGLVGVDRNRNGQFTVQPFQHGHQAPQLFALRKRARRPDASIPRRYR